MSSAIFRLCNPRVSSSVPPSRRFADHARSREPLSHAILKNRIKSPARGGRNLRDRYVVLEKSLRGKEALASYRNNQQQTASANPTLAQPSLKTQTYRGFIVPNEPSPPESDECCMSGCAVCVYDLYEESMEAFKNSVEVLRANLIAMNIPEGEWPKHIQTGQSSALDTQPTTSASVVRSVFEDMERRLKEKQEMRSTNTNAPGS